jgi:hypothetical protein
MKRFIIFLMALVFTLSLAGIANSFTQADLLTLREKVLNHPDVYKDVGWCRLVIKENISGTEYDWRWDICMIEFWWTENNINMTIAKRQYQSTGNHPTSATFIESMYTDYGLDGNLDRFLRDRHLSVKDTKLGSDFIVSLPWADGFNFPNDRLPITEQKKEFEKEIDYWMYKLQ